MTLTEKINEDIKTAMLAKDKDKLEALRAIKAGILLAQSSGENITPESELKMLQKMVKQRKESAEIYKTQNREDLVKTELFQAVVIETYLPTQMTKEEITIAVKNIIAQTGANSVKDMGKVMGMASKELAGKADNKIVSSIVKELLNS